MAKKLSYYAQNMLTLINDHGLALSRITYEDNQLFGTSVKCYNFNDEVNKLTYIVPLTNLIKKEVKCVDNIEGKVIYGKKEFYEQ